MNTRKQLSFVTFNIYQSSNVKRNQKNDEEEILNTLNYSIQYIINNVFLTIQKKTDQELSDHYKNNLLNSTIPKMKLKEEYINNYDDCKTKIDKIYDDIKNSKIIDGCIANFQLRKIWWSVEAKQYDDNEERKKKEKQLLIEQRDITNCLNKMTKHVENNIESENVLYFIDNLFSMNKVIEKEIIDSKVIRKNINNLLKNIGNEELTKKTTKKIKNILQNNPEIFNKSLLSIQDMLINYKDYDNFMDKLKSIKKK